MVAPVFKDVLLNRQHVGVGFYKALFVGKKEKNGRNNETYKYKYIYIYIYMLTHTYIYIYIYMYIQVENKRRDYVNPQIKSMKKEKKKAMKRMARNTKPKTAVEYSRLQ